MKNKNNIKCTEHTINDIITELKKLKSNGVKYPRVLLKYKYPDENNGKPILNKVHMRSIDCTLTKSDVNEDILCIHFDCHNIDRKDKYDKWSVYTKIDDFISFLERIPVLKDVPVALDFYYCKKTCEYDITVNSSDKVWNVYI